MAVDCIYAAFPQNVSLPPIDFIWPSEILVNADDGNEWVHPAKTHLPLVKPIWLKGELAGLIALTNDIMFFD